LKLFDNAKQNEEKMNEGKKQEALENIELIKELVLQTKKHIGNYGGGWICIVWGIFSFLGVAGQRLFIPHGTWIGVWWTGLAVVAGFGTFAITRRYTKNQPLKARHDYMRYFLKFWIPLLLLGYTLAFFIGATPSLSKDYISIVILLVVSTGYLTLGFLLYRGILVMGCIGYVGSIISAIYFLDYSDIILGVLFGTGLIITGLFINKQWKNT
jgi:hypothetical protein